MADRHRSNDEAAELWDRFDDILRRKAPLDYAALQPPASLTEIATAEAAIGVSFTKAMRDAYLRHNGVPMPTRGLWRAGLFDGEAWCCLERMVAYWQMKLEVAESVKRDDADQGSFPVRADWWDELAIYPGWWNPKWIPIGLSGSLPTNYIDLDPGPLGTFGQIINDAGMQSAVLVAPGLNEWVRFVTESFESGRFVTDPQSGEWIDTVWGFHARKSFSYYGWRSSGAVGTGPPA